MKYNKQLEGLKEKGMLKWVPWIGPDYDKHRILILGASHHALWEDKDPSLCKVTEHSKEIEEDSEWYIGLVKLHGIKGESKIFNRMADTLLGVKDSDQAKRAKVWNSVAWMNAIQKTMTESRSTWFDEKESEDSWECIKSVINIIEPKLCIMWGSEVIDPWTKECKLIGEVQKLDQINKTSPRVIKSCQVGKVNLSVTSILHPSRISRRDGTGPYSVSYSVKDWAEFLQNNFSTELQGLQE